MSVLPMNKFIYLFFVTAVLLTQPVWAEEESSEKETVLPAVLEVDYDSLEDIGLYDRGSPLFLGPNFWDNTERSVAQTLIKNMPVHSRSPVMQSLIKGVLLSKSGVGELDDDVEITPGEDLLTLRLNKLIEAGAYGQAFNLYGRIENQPYHETLARAGVLSMLLNGEKSNACLEINTVYPRFEGEALWDMLNLYCDAALSETLSEETQAALENSEIKSLKPLMSDKTYRFPYTPESFAKLSLLERALISAEQALDLSSLDKIDTQSIPPADLLILLHQDQLTAPLRFALSAEAASWGLVDSAYLQSYYKAAFKESSGENKSMSAAYLGESLHTIQEAEEVERLSTIKDIIDSYSDVKPAALLPFAAFIAESSPEGFNFDELYNGVSLMIQAGLDIPENWISTLQSIEAPEDKYPLYINLLAASYISLPSYKQTDKDLNDLRDKIDKAQPGTQVSTLNIIENVDNGMKNVDNAATAYEKPNLLTFSQDYVMPYAAVWDRLKLAHDKHTKAETILLNIVLFSDHTLQNTYPGLLRDSLHSMEYVDFKKASKRMALEALLFGQ